MKNRAPQQSNDTAIAPATLRATGHGTARYAQRFRERFVSDFFRQTTFGLQVSSIGLGTYLGETTDADDAAYESAIRHAVAAGINLLDTAINYRAQRSELAIGAAIQQLIASGTTTREELVVCTKGGYIPLDRTPPATREDYQAYVKRDFLDQQILHADEIVGGGHSLAPRFIRYCLAKSRQNLGLRTVDLYYIHNPEQQLGAVQPDELYSRLEAVFAVLEEAADRGEITHYGIATWDGLRALPDQQGHLSLERVVEAAQRVGGADHRLRGVQLPVNLAMSEAVRTPTQLVKGKLLTVLQAAAELQLAVVGSATLMQARLTNGLPTTLRDAFPSLETDAQRAIAFARSIEGMTASLVGMKRLAHVDENLGAARV